ncbi:MAG: ABC transporter permease [Eubacteriales bacterium]|nr:ABC transporter permease [Eubacteriales bacterium]
MRLYKLEWMKIRLSAYLWAIVGIFASVLALGILFVFLFQIEADGGGISEEAALFGDWNGLFALTTALAFACFSVLSSVLAAKVVVGDYCGANAVSLLSYPVSRKTVFRTKCCIVCGITTASAGVSNLLVIGMMYVTARMFTVAPQMNTAHFMLTVLLSSIFMGISSSAVGIISAAFGWKKRSAVATIVFALLVVCVVTNFITISPHHIVFVMLALCGIFCFIANFMYHMLADGIENMEV